MDPKERVVKAISFQYPDRPPLLLRTDPQRSDIVQVAYSSPPSLEPDEWGCVWDNVIGTGTGQVVRSPLEDWGKLNRYEYPNPHQPYRFADLEEARKRYPDRFLVLAMGLSGFSRMMVLRGFENLLVDIAMREPRLQDLADGVFAFERGIIEEAARRGADGIWFFDDWGTENALFIRPDVWRSFFRPRYASQFELIHQLGMKACFHSCGYIWDIIPDLIEIGVDILNLEQFLIFGRGEENGIDRLARQFAGKACFTVNVDTQRTLDDGGYTEIETEVHHLYRTFWRPEGGFIRFADAGKDHNIHPSENLCYAEQLFLRMERPVV
jgi:uroporphyrinogen-III decarboxylase